MRQGDPRARGDAEEAEAGNDEVLAAPGIERGRGKQRRPWCLRDWAEEETEEKGIWEDPEVGFECGGGEEER